MRGAERDRQDQLERVSETFLARTFWRYGAASARRLLGLNERGATALIGLRGDVSRELERLRGMTKIEIEKVSAAAKVEIEAAERAARVELKALAAKLAMDRAESLVSTQMTPAVQETTINSFVQTLQGRPN